MFMKVSTYLTCSKKIYQHVYNWAFNFLVVGDKYPAVENLFTYPQEFPINHV